MSGVQDFPTVAEIPATRPWNVTCYSCALRFGFGDDIKPTPRRPVEDVLV